MKKTITCLLFFLFFICLLVALIFYASFKLNQTAAVSNENILTIRENSTVKRPIPRIQEEVPTLPVEPSVTDAVTVTALHIRDTHSYTGNVVGYLDASETVTVMLCSDGWAKIDDGQWVNAKYLEPTICQ